jgi:hypothetical protein
MARRGTVRRRARHRPPAEGSQRRAVRRWHSRRLRRWTAETIASTPVREHGTSRTFSMTLICAALDLALAEHQVAVERRRLRAHRCVTRAGGPAKRPNSATLMAAEAAWPCTRREGTSRMCSPLTPSVRGSASALKRFRDIEPTSFSMSLTGKGTRHQSPSPQTPEAWSVGVRSRSVRLARSTVMERATTTPPPRRGGPWARGWRSCLSAGPGAPAMTPTTRHAMPDGGPAP